MIEQPQVLLYGASGHCKVISSILESQNRLVHGIFDDNLINDNACSFNFLGAYDSLYNPDMQIIISIGNNKIRKYLSTIVKHKFAIGIHSSVIIDKYVKIDEGAVLMQGAIVQRDVVIEKHCIINTNASIDHDCIISSYAHISPSATLCGNVKIGEGSHVGAGAIVIPNIKIGKWCVIGAGAVVTKNIPDYSLVVGVPGKIIKKLGNE